MKKIAALTAAALVAVSAIGPNAAQARDGGAIAAGVIGGLAAGALLGAAVANAHEAPGYGYGPPPPAYGYGYGAPAPVRYRAAPVVRDYDDEEVTVYRTRRVVRSYDSGPGAYGYRAAGYGHRRDCGRSYGYGYGHGGW